MNIVLLVIALGVGVLIGAILTTVAFGLYDRRSGFALRYEKAMASQGFKVVPLMKRHYDDAYDAVLARKPIDADEAEQREPR